MGEGPPVDGAPSPRASWRPEIRGDRAWIGVTGTKRVIVVVAAGTVAFLVTALVRGRVGFPAFAAFVLLAAAARLLCDRVGVELGPSTLMVRGVRPLRARTVRWSAVVGVDLTDDATVVVDVAGGPLPIPRLVLRRGDGLLDDADFDEKLALIEGWWRACRDAAPHASSASVGEAEQLAFPLGPLVGDAVDEGENRGGSPFPLGTLLTLFGVAAAVGYLFIGRDVIVIAIALLVLLRFGRDPARPLALAAFLLLTIAAAATLVQDFPPQVSLAFANRRTVAAEAGAIVGVFLVLAALVFSVTERAPAPARPRARRQGGELPTPEVVVRRALAALSGAAPYLAALVVGAVVRVAAAPAPLPASSSALVANLRLGTGYSSMVPMGSVPDLVRPPLAPALAAYAPFGTRVVLLVVSVASIAVAGRVAHSIGGRRASIGAVGIAALLPSMWMVQLPLALAMLFVGLAVLLADPRWVTPRRALAAGACAGCAALARPDAAIAAMVIAWWLASGASDAATPAQARRGAPVAAFVVAAALTLAPWLSYVWSELGVGLPTASLATTLGDPDASSSLPLLLATPIAAGVLGAMGIAVRRIGARNVPLPVVALPVASAALWLATPGSRDPLGWSAPLVAAMLGSAAARLAVRRARAGDAPSQVVAGSSTIDAF